MPNTRIPRHPRYLSLFSGIEAATVAWRQLGWHPVAFAEINRFACSVLARRFPDIPNLGDVIDLKQRLETGEDVEGLLSDPPEIVVGGSPCQAYSVAGARGSMKDPRGQLMFAFTRIADLVRPKLVLWENVAGVLSTKDNAFGHLLGALSGHLDPLEPDGKKWATAGRVDGPIRRLAWRVLDAQHFGVPQRRCRVFLMGASVASGIDPAAILFEYTGNGAPHVSSAPFVKKHSSLADVLEPPEAIPPHYNLSPRACAGILRRAERRGKRLPDRLRNALESQVHRAPALLRGDPPTCGGVPHRPITICRGVEPTSPARSDAGGGLGTDTEINGALVVGYAPEICITLAASGRGVHRVGEPRGQDPLVVQGHLRLRTECFGGNRTSGAIDVATACNAHGGCGRMDFESETLVVHGSQDPCVSRIAFALGRNSGQENAMFVAEGVRRLTPVECERLQGFPDGWTLIGTARKNHPANARRLSYLNLHSGLSDPDALLHLAADGPRYRAIGNSMAVPVMRWIGARINSLIVNKRGFACTALKQYSQAR